MTIKGEMKAIAKPACRGRFFRLVLASTGNQPRFASDNNCTARDSNPRRTTDNSRGGSPERQVVRDNEGVSQLLDSDIQQVRRCERNIPIQLPAEYDFTVLETRLGSFAGRWPQGAAVSPGEMAPAGLYYVGPADKVRCGYCQGALYNWEVGDNALEEHRKHFPQCPFVNNAVNQPRIEQTTVHSKRENAVSISRDLGFPDDVINEALHKLEQANQSDITTGELIDAIHEIQKRQEYEDSSQERLSHRVSGENSSLPVDVEEVRKLVEENARIRDTTTCKVCMERTVSVLFLPCRHLVSCESCSDAMRHCPLCRQEIVATVKTFLS